MDWLFSMGYSHAYHGDTFSFLGTCEHLVAHQSKQARKRNALKPEDRKQALKWYANAGYSLQTIADHFKISLEALKMNLRTEF